ncbi:MAG: sigma-54-dependent Fis family transcriptional regulator [Deltaproteobacteria bacterium]|nr:sigma-54-dependent Fis family transcriptional regulator [Deltaproteobacteria bacterium]
MKRWIQRVLVVDDEENIRLMLQTILEQQGYDVVVVADADGAIEALRSHSFDLMLTDVRMPGLDGLELLEVALNKHPELVAVVMSAYGSVDSAIEAIKLGAYDYIAKPFKAAEIVLLIRKAEERERLRRENRRLKADLARAKEVGLGRMVAKAAPMREMFRTIRKIAGYKTTVLIEGESGTGKELVARALHENSPRASATFVAVNCGAIPETLLESELFGHRKGAFTDATHDKPGLFMEAHKGTIFLDEIGELPLSLQVKLLRVLQEEEIRWIGDSRVTKIDVRVIAATVRDLVQEVAEGRFREDLFYRLNVLPLRLPPLRERLEDVSPLVTHFVQSNNERLGMSVEGVTPEAMKVLMSYAWPGNVRELENTIEHAMVLSDGPVLGLEGLPAKLRDTRDPIRAALTGDDLSVKKATRVVEETLIRRALEKTAGNRTYASKLLEISHRALLYKIKEYNIDL